MSSSLETSHETNVQDPGPAPLSSASKSLPASPEVHTEELLLTFPNPAIVPTFLVLNFVLYLGVSIKTRTWIKDKMEINSHLLGHKKPLWLHLPLKSNLRKF